MSNIQLFQKSTYLLPKEGKMRVPGLVIGSEAMLKDPEIEKPLEQVRNVATLPGIVNYSIAMPDIHWGYGFPIGGVAAMDPETGVISPGGVGYNIRPLSKLHLIIKMILFGIFFVKFFERMYSHTLSKFFKKSAQK